VTNETESATSPWATRASESFAKFVSLRWVPLTAALLSLPLSATAILISLQQPEVLLILPDQVRVAQGRPSGAAYLYLQPAFVSTGRNERIEVIRDMRLDVSGPGGRQRRSSGPSSCAWSANRAAAD
jgi:hypothetical protein